MAKIDIANEIVNEFPEKNYDAQQLVESHTEKELNDLQLSLKNEKEQQQQAQGQVNQGQEMNNQQVQTQVGESPEVVNNPVSSQNNNPDQVVQEIMEQVGTGRVQGSFKLSDPKTQFAEKYENGEEFTLVGDQEKQLPSEPSNDLIERIRSGYIVRV